MANLSDLRINNETIEVNGSVYLVTWDTGEIGYGSDLGGGGAFAYDESDIDTLQQPASYADFCDAATPIGEDDPNWLELAVALAVQGRRLTIAGSCRPALTDREYTVARIASR
jgi:hypothetical protein